MRGPAGAGLWGGANARGRVADRDGKDFLLMPDPVACEYCGRLVQLRTALLETVDDRPYYFCSEVCKFRWGEQADREMDDDVDKGRT